MPVVSVAGMHPILIGITQYYTNANVVALFERSEPE